MDEYLVFNQKNVDDRQIDTLIGLSKGLLADGQLVPAEVEFLHTWLIQARQATSHPIIINLFDKVSTILSDGVVDREECDDLLGILARFTGETSEMGESFGRKIELAMEYRERGLPLAIISEVQWATAGRLIEV